MRDHRRVEIAEAIARICEHSADLAQQPNAVRAEIAVVRVGEALADIANRRRAEQRVHDGVDEHVRVRMAVEPLFIRDRHAAEDELPARHEPMNVVTVADPHASCLLRMMSAASSRSSGVVSLIFSSSPSVSCTGMPSASTALQSSVSARP